MEQTSSSLHGHRAILLQNVPLSSGSNFTQQWHTLCNSIGYFWRHRRWQWSGRSDNPFNFIIETPVQTYQRRNGQNALLCRNNKVSKPIIGCFQLLFETLLQLLKVTWPGIIWTLIHDKIRDEMFNCTLLYRKHFKQFWNLFIAVYNFLILVKNEFRFEL